MRREGTPLQLETWVSTCTQLKHKQNEGRTRSDAIRSVHYVFVIRPFLFCQWGLNAS